MDTEKTVLVAVRSRPLLQKGEEIYNAGLRFCESEVAVQDKAFNFDYIFPPGTPNVQVYDAAVKNRLPRVFEGYNLTIFAYGQTGSGKTYTMGTNYPPVLQNESGIIVLSVTRIFDDIKQREDDYKFIVSVSFLEVYKEDVYDLLSKDKKSSMRQIREDSDGVKVVNLTEVVVSSVEEVLAVLEQGCQARSTASTAMNEHSSRSHSLFILSIEQTNKQNFETKKSKFQLVDLAGSERADQSKTEGLRFKEGVDINRGLLALGKVISALSDGKSHIPYRDSRLTRLLMDSLGGNSYTLMIACISPSANNSDETLSTLRYASRARKIKNKPVVNNDPPDVQIQKLKNQVELLQVQLYRRSCNSENSNCESGGMEDYSDLKEQNLNLKNEVHKSLARIAELKGKLIELEQKLGMMSGKINDLYQQIQSCINKINENSSLPVSDVLIYFKSIEAELQDLVFKFKANLLAVEMDYSQGTNPFVPGIRRNIPSGSETSSEDEVSSDLEVADIDRKLEKVELRLLKKQEIAQQFEVLTDAIDSGSTQNLNVLQEKIDKLLKERNELELALKNSEKRLFEERNKRYNECQTEIKALEKELLRSKLLKKIKDENKMKIDNLQREIQSLKSTKVKLLKKMKVENDNFRRLQIAKDREMEKLKKNERKKDFEMLKLKNNFEKKVNAFKQKIEKCQSLNKRLNEALSRQKSSSLLLVKDKKLPKPNIEFWLSKEIEVEALKRMASSEYIEAKENMGHLAEEAHNIQKVSTEANSENNSSALILLSLEAEKLGKEKPAGNELISGEKNSDRWKTINSMIDAKTALTVLFEKCIDDYIKINSDNGLHSASMQKDSAKDKEFEQERKNLLIQIKSLKDKLLKTKKEKCEQDVKVIQYLKEMSDFDKYFIEHQSESELLEKMQSHFSFQKSEMKQLAEKLEDYEKLTKEIEFLREECKKLKMSKRKRYLNDFGQTCSSTASVQDINGAESLLAEYLDEEIGNDSFQLDDNKDPDWRMTPIYKQRKRTIHRLKEQNGNSETFDDSDIPQKRSFSGCSCPSDCKTMRCACRKKFKACDSACNCNHDVCLNIETSEEKA